jgi:phage terminase large subunit
MLGKVAILMAFIIIQNHPDGLEFRGANWDFLRSGHPEGLIAGAAETGKTYAACWKLHLLCMAHKNSQASIIRQVQADMPGTVIVTWEGVIKLAMERGLVSKYGGERPEFYQYKNGSRVWIGGLDRPGKVLSGERDFVYINQAEELSLHGYETITTRCTGRAANAPFHQIMADCNPGSNFHWLLNRIEAGHMRRFDSRHEDNPTLFNADGTITARGKETMRVLDALTGIRYKRLRLGLWCGEEGLVYGDEFDRGVHVIDFDYSKQYDWHTACDWGYNNAFAFGLYALSHDGVLTLVKEIYFTQRTVEEHCVTINRLIEGKNVRFCVTDHDPNLQRVLQQQTGLCPINADKNISSGIEYVRNRLKNRTLLYARDALVERDARLVAEKKPASTLDEYAAYSWPTGQDGKSLKEVPIDNHNHAMDRDRYLCAYLAKPRGVRGGTF